MTGCASKQEQKLERHIEILMEDNREQLLDHKRQVGTLMLQLTLTRELLNTSTELISE